MFFKETEKNRYKARLIYSLEALLSCHMYINIFVYLKEHQESGRPPPTDLPKARWFKDVGLPSKKIWKHYN